VEALLNYSNGRESKEFLIVLIASANKSNISAIPANLRKSSILKIKEQQNFIAM
jgi:hypothetical protein